MVGGRSFSLRGRMFCGVTSSGLMVRVGRDGITSALQEPHVSRMSLGGRPLAAFVIVAPSGVPTDALLAAWVQRAISVVTHEMSPAGRAKPPAAVGSSVAQFAELVEHFTHDADVTLPEHGGGFGSSALKVDGSIFAMLAGDQLVVKLPRARVTELIDAGSGVPYTAGKAAPMKRMACRHHRRAIGVAGLGARSARLRRLALVPQNECP